MPDAVDTVVCAPDDGWKYHPKHVQQFPDINKLCNVVSCWIYIGILLAHPILHISRIRVNLPSQVLRGFQCKDFHEIPNHEITFFLWACLELKLIQIGLKMYTTEQKFNLSPQAKHDIYCISFNEMHV
jgi:hypothetical protein